MGHEDEMMKSGYRPKPTGIEATMNAQEGSCRAMKRLEDYGWRMEFINEPGSEHAIHDRTPFQPFIVACPKAPHTHGVWRSGYVLRTPEAMMMLYYGFNEGQDYANAGGKFKP